MRIMKWFDESFEEAFMIILLAGISCVMMAQIVARKIGMPMTWPEEFCRYLYVWSVFLSLGYTVKKGNMLRVGIVMDLLPSVVKKTVFILVDVIVMVIFAVFCYNSFKFMNTAIVSGQASSAMRIPMSFMCSSTIIGFGLGTIRSAQKIVYEITHFGDKTETTLEATIKEAQQEASAVSKEGGNA